MPRTVKNNLCGKRFGRLFAYEFIPDDSQFSKFSCICDCGNKTIVMGQSLIRGATVSCGCFFKEMAGKKALTHGENMGSTGRTRTYSSWASMMTRSEWGNHPSYERYGAKGIRVCERWKSFENFKADMGERPECTSIDRIDNTKGYCKENCRWATRKQQALNKSNTSKVFYNGKIALVHDICVELGLSRKAVRSRAFRRGGDYVAALESLGIKVSSLDK
jgi:hypothetical protein